MYVCKGDIKPRMVLQVFQLFCLRKLEGKLADDDIKCINKDLMKNEINHRFSGLKRWNI